MILKSQFLILAILLLVFPYIVTGQILYDVDDFGARGDGNTMNTSSIQRTIDK